MSLALDMGLGHALSKKLQATLGQVDNLTLVLIFEFVIGFDLAVAQRSSAVSLDFDAWRMSKRNEDTADSQVQQVRLEIVAKSQDRNSGCHFGLNSDGNVKDQLLALLHGASIENESLVAIGAGCEVSEG
ncbi:hypothetical protein HG531_008280 [Fusarium graminearum]|nr:hypothetical protein HG531_008280 [Fusarium graminearum]